MKKQDKNYDYVAGFLFTEDRKHVLLIEKQKPAWQKGKLNGIGGKIELDENPEHAMMREFLEEVGIEISPGHWNHFSTLYADAHSKHSDKQRWKVRFYYAFGNVMDARQMEIEKPRIVSVNKIGQLETIPNLRWLIPMALTMDKERASLFKVQEI